MGSAKQTMEMSKGTFTVSLSLRLWQKGATSHLHPHFALELPHQPTLSSSCQGQKFGPGRDPRAHVAALPLWVPAWHVAVYQPVCKPLPLLSQGGHQVGEHRPPLRTAEQR